MNCFDTRVLLEESSDLARILGVPAHTIGQSRDAPHHQPAIKRSQHRTPHTLNLTDTLEEIVVLSGDDRAAKNITVAAQIFCGGMYDQITAKRQRALQTRRGPGVIAHTHGARTTRDLCNRHQIGNLEQGVRGRFRPDELCSGPQRIAHLREVRHIHKGGFEVPRAKEIA